MLAEGTAEVAEMRRRFPMHVVDRFFLITEHSLPSQTCMWVLEFDELELDRARFERAVTAAFARHPKACLQRAVGKGLTRPPEWELIPGAAEGACVVHSAEYGAGTELPQALAELMNTELSPSEGPLVQFHWLPRGGIRPVLCYRFHHALADGYGSLVLLRDVFLAYEGTELEPRHELIEPPPLVAGSSWARFRLLFRLFWFHFTRTVSSRFRAPEKLFELAARPEPCFGIALRVLAAEQVEEFRRAASRLGASFNDLLLAAWALGIERFTREQGRDCNLLRFTINQRLRKPNLGLETVSSAFQVWVNREDRQDLPTLVKRIRAQVRDCLRKRIAQATALFSNLLRLPFPVARRLLLPTVTRPRLSDTLVVSNLEGALSMLTSSAGSCLGGARIVGAYALVVPPAGVGALVTVSNGALGMTLALNYLQGLLNDATANRLLGQVEEALATLYASLSAAETPPSDAWPVSSASG
jgi:NRPS condensation-like uncharacterized protein